MHPIVKPPAIQMHHAPTSLSVIPAKAGIQVGGSAPFSQEAGSWTPTFVGVTEDMTA
jgi:hypothetical protein